MGFQFSGPRFVRFHGVLNNFMWGEYYDLRVVQFGGVIIPIVFRGFGGFSGFGSFSPVAWSIVVENKN